MANQKPLQKKPAADVSSRQTAADLLSAVLDKRITFDRALHRAMARGRMATLSPRDKAFARLLAVTVLRRKGQIDDALARFIKKPLPVKAERAIRALQIGAVELLFLDAPAHAAVSSAVALAATDHRSAIYKGLVNAVLRRVGQARQKILLAQDPVALNVPAWLRASWTEAYGEAVTEEIAKNILTEPSLDITPKSAPDAEALARPLGASLLPTGTLRRPMGGVVDALPGFAQGAWWVQDAAATLPVRLLGDISGRSVIDLCAAPGGKTAQLASLGAEVTALDKAGGRVKLIKDNLDRLNLTAHFIEADACQWRPKAPAPFVLLDAPCTSTGTIRRHPDVMHLKGPEDVRELGPLQAALLDAAAKMVAPGGLLVYCTCSLQPEEGERQIDTFLTRRPDMVRQSLTPGEVMGCAQFITPQGDLRTLPSHWPEYGGLDGFYAARLVKN